MRVIELTPARYDFFCTGYQYREVFAGVNDAATAQATAAHLAYQDNEAHTRAAAFAVQRLRSDMSLLGLGGAVNGLTGGTTLDPILG